MVDVIPQIGSAAFLAVLTIRVMVSSNRRSSREWTDILCQFHGGHAELARAASLTQDSNDGGVRPFAGPASIDGISGLWKMYSNAGVFIEIVDFLCCRCAGEPTVTDRLTRARNEIKRTRLILLVATVAPLRIYVTSGLASYVSSIIIVSHVIEEYFPNLIRTYRYFVTREYCDLDNSPI